MHNSSFSFFRKLVKVTIKSDRQRWLKSVDDNLISQPKQIWKYVSNFRRKDNNFTQIKVDDHFVTDPKNIDYAFANHFKSTVNTSCPTVTAPQPLTTDFLPTAPVSAAEVSKAVKRLKPSKCVGLDGIPLFNINGCSDIFIPLPTFIFNLSVSSEIFTSLWKETAVVPVFKKGSSAMVRNYRPMSILNNFSKIFEFIIYDHLYCVFKYRLNPSQHGFRKHNSTTTNLITYLNTVMPSVNTQCQTDSVYFDLSNALILFPIIYSCVNSLTPVFLLVMSIGFTATWPIDNRVFVFLVPFLLPTL
jgi:hypothetical protein